MIFFDEASIGNPGLCGVGEILHIIENHTISFGCGLGEESHNMEKLKAILLVEITLESVVRELHIYDDSQFVLNWFNSQPRK